MEADENNILNIDIFKKLFSQCLDATFVLCDWAYRSNYGPRKFQEIFDQIFPSAIVLRSPYWPRYRHPNNKKHLCICDHYGIVCKHNSLISGPKHFFEDPDNEKFHRDNFGICHGTIKPVKYNITCMPTPANLPKGYLVSAKIFVKGSDCPALHKRRKQLPNHFFINNRYAFVKRIRSLHQTFVFGSCNNLKKSADLILSSKDNYEFPEQILNGYSLETEEFPMWTACVFTTQMIPRKYLNIIKNKKNVRANNEGVTTDKEGTSIQLSNYRKPPFKDNVSGMSLDAESPKN
ncbi:uncharacterized protein LOC123014748 [Tribolium madens]|uniref:uncharacterized protein LOC123014748 n=1 Tax=Tribolium madens TaxID=41895 RepID=UPI001CF73802|nr:uncharacterized protein LOC123014748 [Tribolium madens]